MANPEEVIDQKSLDVINKGREKPWPVGTTWHDVAMELYANGLEEEARAKGYQVGATAGK
jgi:hypothetical protein